VRKDNIVSFTDKTTPKQLQEGRSAYLKRGRFFCPYHIHKPRDGTKENLLQHVKALANDVDDDDLHVRGQHAALLGVLGQDAHP
jgi:hypothetical protein